MNGPSKLETRSLDLFDLRWRLHAPMPFSRAWSGGEGYPKYQLVHPRSRYPSGYQGFNVPAKRCPNHRRLQGASAHIRGRATENNGRRATYLIVCTFPSSCPACRFLPMSLKSTRWRACPAALSRKRRLNDPKRYRPCRPRPTARRLASSHCLS
jgi:hypothetical protein